MIQLDFSSRRGCHFLRERDVSARFKKYRAQLNHLLHQALIPISSWLLIFQNTPRPRCCTPLSSDAQYDQSWAPVLPLTYAEYCQQSQVAFQWGQLLKPWVDLLSIVASRCKRDLWDQDLVPCCCRAQTLIWQVLWYLRWKSLLDIVWWQQRGSVS